MSDIDPFDDELGAALRRRAGAVPTSTAAAHDAVLRRAGTIRRRRASVGGAAAVAVVLAGGFTLLPRGADEIGPAMTGEVMPTFDEATTTVTVADAVESPDATPTTVDLTIPTVGLETSVPDTSIPSIEAEVSTSSSPATPPDPTTARPSFDTTAPTAGSTAVPTTETTPETTTETTTETTSTSAAETAPAPFTDTYRSAGGSITVSWNGSSLSLVSVSPASEHVAEVEHSSATRVRVRFESDADDSRIEVRIEGDQVAVDID